MIAETAPPVTTVPPEAPDPLVGARGLSVRLGGRLVLDTVDVEVAPGEIVSLIGPNGSGKTTLVRALLGLVRPSSGEVYGRPRRRIGYVPQRMAIDETLPLSARRFLKLWGRVTEDELARALAAVGVAHVADTALSRLSGGEFQRVLLARALLQRPELLILDEPIQGVDVQGQSQLYALIARVRRELGCGVLLVSHDLHLVMAQTDRVLCLNGHVCCSGTPEAVVRHPSYMALFGDRVAGMADLAVYRHAHDHSHDGPHDHDSSTASGEGRQLA